MAKGQYLYSKIHTAQIKVADDITGGTTDAGEKKLAQHKAGRHPTVAGLLVVRAA